MNPLLPWIAKTISSRSLRDLRRRYHGAKRKLLGKRPTVHVFISPADPYSILLTQVLKPLKARFDVDWQYHTVMERPSNMYPKPEYWFEHALEDSQHLSKLYELPNLKYLPSTDQCEALAHQWACQEDSEEFLDFAASSGLSLWTSENSPFGNEVDTHCHRTAERVISKNEKLRHKLGHYFSAMLYFEGEWYWGLDRLEHLEIRLNEMELNSSSPTIQFNRQHMSANKQVTDKTALTPKQLTLYFSLRSPYSYLALIKAHRLKEEYNVQLNLKVVLPMVMRGLPVPNRKKMYIFLDTKREADKQNIPYGFVSDPLGTGVLNCYALYDEALKQDKGLQLMLEFAKGINSEALNAEKLSDLKTMVERAGLNWNELKPVLDLPTDEQEQWRSWADKHEQELYQLGLWGVPCLIMDDLKVWGQDRFFVIEEHLQKLQAEQPQSAVTT